MSDIWEIFTPKESSMTESNEDSKQDWQESKKTTEIAAFIAGGGVLSSGAVVAGSTAIGVGLLPVAALGMVVGLAAYGVKQALFFDVKSPPTTSEIDKSATSQDNEVMVNKVVVNTAADMPTD
jgi:hypothetical protein